MDYSFIIKEFPKKKILVIGDIILDRYIWGRVERISPEAPVPVVDVVREDYMLGGAGNVASNIISLGGQATIVGITGKDSSAETLKRLFDNRRIKTALFEDERPTTVKTRVIAHNQQVVRFDMEQTDKIQGKLFEKMLSYVKKAVPVHDAVIVSDYKKGVISAQLIKEILNVARGKKFIAVDPKVGHFHIYKGVTLITPNKSEAQEGSGIKITDKKSLLKAGRTLMRRLDCPVVLITLGEQGMCLFEKGRVTEIPTFAKKVYDVSGAGDTVIAAFTLAHAAGASLLDAAVIANHAAGIVVGEVGTATVTPEQLLDAFRKEACITGAPK